MAEMPSGLAYTAEQVWVEDEGGDSRCVRSSGACAEALALCGIWIARVVTRENRAQVGRNVRAVGGGDARLETHFRRSQTVIALVVVDCHRPRRCKRLWQARTEYAVSGATIATVCHGVSAGGHRVVSEILGGAVACATITGQQVADMGREVKPSRRYHAARDHILNLRNRSRRPIGVAELDWFVRDGSVSTLKAKTLRLVVGPGVVNPAKDCTVSENVPVVVPK